MFIHSVYFSLPDSFSPADGAAFEAALHGLTAIEGALHAWAGPPVASARPVVDGDYSFGLTVVFKDAAAHDAYQTHPTHQAFLARYAPRWNRVRVFDFSE